MRRAFRSNVIHSKVKARLRQRVRELQAEFDAECDAIEAEFLEDVAALRKRLADSLSAAFEAVAQCLRDAVREIREAREQRRMAEESLEARKDEVAEALVERLVPRK